jgi:hypothetical protein
MLLSGSIAESIALKFTLAHRLSVLLALMAFPAQLLAQTTADAPPPQADINSMPKWSEFPVSPTNVTTAAEFQADVSKALEKRQQLRTEVRALVWDNTVPENFAEARDRIDPAFTAPIEAQTTPAEINALADELRKRATPPPVVK